MIFPSDKVKRGPRVPSPQAGSTSTAECELADLLGRLIARRWINTGGKPIPLQSGRPRPQGSKPTHDPIGDPQP